jgi:D-alanyl-D-alanine carboxypeptidase
LFRSARVQGVLGLIAAILTVGIASSADARTHHGHRHHAAAAPTASRYAAIVVDADTGRVLSSTNPDRRSYPASLTKMMTLYLLFDALDQGKLRLDSQLTASARAAGQAPSKLALEPGDHIRVEDAILALVTKSANDVAVVVAETLGGTEANFAQMMTAKAHALGMDGTTYRNASGLPIAGQVSTPRDQSMLARALIHNHARYYHYFGTREFDWQGATIPSHNRFMLNYDGADGIKTGYINASGFNLVASAVHDGHRLIGVVFGGNTAPWRDQRMVQLMDHGFAKLGVPDTEMADANDSVEEPDPTAAPPKIPAHIIAQANAYSPPARHTVHKAKPRDEGDDDENSPWAIQVGAFAKFKPAHHAAATAAKRLGGLIAKASIDIDEGGSAKHAVYRARLIGFTEEQARAACRKLAKTKNECHIVDPSS